MIMINFLIIRLGTGENLRFSTGEPDDSAFQPFAAKAASDALTLRDGGVFSTSLASLEN